jgi:hypothetical protein
MLTAIFKGLLDSSPQELPSFVHRVFADEMSCAGNGNIPSFGVVRDGLRRVRNVHDWISFRPMNPIWATGITISPESEDENIRK